MALQHVRRVVAAPTVGPLLALVFTMVFFSLKTDRFFQAGNFSLVLQQVLIVGVLAIGQTLVILTAGIDLSVGTVMALGQVIMTKLAVANGGGQQTQSQPAMENCLQKNPKINVLYTINEPSAAGAWTALKKAGKKPAGVTIVSVDGGCAGVRNVKAGIIDATSQQYPLRMASLGVAAVVKYANGGTKASGYTDTGLNLIARKPLKGVPSKSVKYGLANCWG